MAHPSLREFFDPCRWHVISIVERNPRTFISRINDHLQWGYLVKNISYKVGWFWVTYTAVLVKAKASSLFIAVEGVERMAVTLTDAQKVALTFKATNAAGNPSPVAEPTWTSSDESIITLEIDAGGLTAYAITTGKLGDATVTLSALAGNDALTTTLDITVVASPATKLEIEVGEPIDK